MNRLWLGTIALVGSVCLCGCQDQSTLASDQWLLVSFKENVPVTYRMTSERSTELTLTGGEKEKKSRPQITTEKLEMVLVYTPVQVDPFGLTTLEVTCKSSNVTRKGFAGQQNTADVMQDLKGKKFTLKISPTGRIEDYSDLERVAKELGKKTFTSRDSGSRIKNPDMINDFTTLQQLLWDAAASIPNQRELKIGTRWQVQQPIAWPMPMYPPPSRITTYTLGEIDQDTTTPDSPRKAIISSTYAISEKPLETYLKPYEVGRFQVRGIFGFLRHYQFKTIEGSGRQVFNLDDGLLESDKQEYHMVVNATFMLPLGNSLPVLNVDQKFSITRIPSTK